MLAQSAAAHARSVAISYVTLTGTAQSIAGSDDESGTVVLKAMAAGESRMDLTLPGGVRSEIRSFDANGNLLGAWSGFNGIQHAISYLNLLTDSSWFFPVTDEFTRSFHAFYILLTTPLLPRKVAVPTIGEHGRSNTGVLSK